MGFHLPGPRGPPAPGLPGLPGLTVAVAAVAFHAFHLRPSYEVVHEAVQKIQRGNEVTMFWISFCGSLLIFRAYSYCSASF